MKIYHLNCGTLVPPLLKIKSLVYCLLVDTGDRLVLIDTGFGREDYTNPSRKMRFFLRYMGVPRDLSETAFSQVRELGYQPEDVTEIICTHLHIDHAGGLRDFPWATVHVYFPEYQFACQPRGWSGFATDPAHWSHQPDWKLYYAPDQDWLGMPAVRLEISSRVDFRLVPLPGHTPGHCGVAVGKEGQWLLHCGDAASPYHPAADLHQYDPQSYRLSFLPEFLVHKIAGLHSPRLRNLLSAHHSELEIISSHDSFSFHVYNKI